jgi:hypothetical protein
MAGYCEVSMKLIVKHATTDEIVDAVINAAYNNLTSSQYTQVTQSIMTAQSEFGSMEKVNKTIQKCVSGAGPVLADLYPKVGFLSIKKRRILL